MTTRVLHIATHGHNIGDGALVAGIHRTLREDLQREIEFIPFDVLGCKLRHQYRMLDRAELRRWEQRADLVLVGGGGMIEGGLGSFLSGINFNFDPALLSSTSRPWAFYALGMNQFRGTRFHHRGRLRKLIDMATERGFPFSVRNDGSQERLQRLLRADLPIQTVPDPGLYVPTRQRALPELASDRPNVLVQLAGDRLESRMGRGWLPARARQLVRRAPRLTSQLAKALVAIRKQHRVRFVFCPHLLVDVAPLAALLKELPNHLVREDCVMTHVVNGAVAAPDFFEVYRQVDLVVGMRGHSSICAVGLGTPFVGLGSHDKVGGFLKDMGLQDYLIDLKADPHLTRVAPLVCASLDRLPAMRAEMQPALARCRARTRELHLQIGAML